MQLANFSDLKLAFIDLLEKTRRRFKELNLDEAERELKELQDRSQDPSLWEDANRDKLKEMQIKMASLDRKIESWKELSILIQDDFEYLEIAELENETELLKDLNEKLEQLKIKYNQLDLESLLNGDDDYRNAFLNIHPGAGGTESQDWAEMLYRAYTRWAEKKGFKLEVLDFLEGDEAGVKNVTLLISGLNSYGYLKHENGIHRLVRISPFDANKKRHTSFSAVHVSPELSENVNIEVQEKDMRIDTYRSSGAGGQHINKTDSAVRITHHPSGIVVACQSERSQIKNKATAMKMLKARLYELAQEEKEKEIESKSGERKDISWGNQIRSYVFHPYSMVKDLRTGIETSDVNGVMDGNFDPFIDASLRNIKRNKP
jgi:peptide chain release factor 2